MHVGILGAPARPAAGWPCGWPRPGASVTIGSRDAERAAGSPPSSSTRWPDRAST